MQKFIYVFLLVYFFCVSLEVNRRISHMTISKFSPFVTRGVTVKNETASNAGSCPKPICPQIKCPDENGPTRDPSVGLVQSSDHISSDLVVSTSEQKDDKAHVVKGIIKYDMSVEGAARNFGIRESVDTAPKFSDEGTLNFLEASQNSVPIDRMNGLVFMLAFMTGVADVAIVLKYENFATMVC